MQDYFGGNQFTDVWKNYENVYHWLVVILLVVIMVLSSIIVHYATNIPEGWYKFWEKKDAATLTFRDRMAPPGGYLGGSLNTVRTDLGTDNKVSLEEQEWMNKNKYTERLLESGRDMNISHSPSGEDLATIMALQNSGAPRAAAPVAAGFRDRLTAKDPSKHVNY